MTPEPSAVSPRISARSIAVEAVKGFLRSWRTLALTDIAWKIVAFAVLTPASALLLRWLMSRAEGQVVADLDIATFFLTTPVGALTLILGVALVAGITALEMACLMAIGLAAAKGVALSAKDALLFAVSRAQLVLRLTLNMAVRLLGGLLPFLLVAGVTYWLLLREHDINYYIAARPPQFWVAAAIAAALVIGLVVLLVRTIGRWALALPLVLFEDVSPRRALNASAARVAGNQTVVIGLLASWAILAVLLVTVIAWVPELIGRNLAPPLADSLALLLLLITGLALLWGALVLAAGIVNASLFALLIVRLYVDVGDPRNPRLPQPGGRERRTLGIPQFVKVGGVAIVLLAALGFVLLTVAIARRTQPVVVIAHRGSSETAPENTLAAFRLAGDQRADFVEFDVQESLDGEVIVMHDSDLMRVGRSGMKVWEAAAADLRAIDIGSYRSPQFSSERVPTLAETLAACKGRTHVVVELKSYGHDQRLEERVVSIVEAAGMVDDSIFMSLNHDMVRKIKELRPSWRAGVLVAKAIGDLTSLRADFLAVEARLATRSFIRQAHRAGQEVYVWTLNDPAWMLAALSNGVDGLITDRPDVARLVVERRNSMTDAQRILVALLIRLGVRIEALEAEDALKP